MKKIISLTAAVLMLCCLLSACSSAPAIEDIRSRAQQLITDSAQLNTVFFGTGLPTYPRVDLPTDQPLEYNAEHDAYYILFEDAEYGEICAHYNRQTRDYTFYQLVRGDASGVSDAVYVDTEAGIYLLPSDYTEPKVEYVYTADDPSGYDVVCVDAPYTSIDELKAAAKKVFSAEYLELIYSAAFDGIAFVEGATSGVRSARFIEKDGLLRQANDIEPRLQSQRIYDFSTMKIVRPSNAKRVNISVETHLEGDAEILKVNIVLVLGEDGQWYLDSPTY